LAAAAEDLDDDTEAKSVITRRRPVKRAGDGADA
jgi:hypothetical protein